jgi:hypothetical protein
VTGWSVRTADTGAVYGLRVLHPNGGLSYASTQVSALAPAISSPSDATYHFTTLPIQLGDAIGVSTTPARPASARHERRNPRRGVRDQLRERTTRHVHQHRGLHELLLRRR